MNNLVKKLFISNIALVSALIYLPVAPYISVYVVMLMSIFGFACIGNDKNINDVKYLSILVLVCLILISASALSNDRVLENAKIVVFIAPIFVAPLLILLVRNQGYDNFPHFVASICVLGAVCSAVVSLNEVFILGVERAGGGNNPIHFASLALLVGFMSMLGIFFGYSAWRFVFLVGPMCGFFVTYLSGSRGPVLSSFGMMIIVLVFLALRFWRIWTFHLLFFFAALLTVLFSTFTPGYHFNRLLSVWTNFAALLEGKGLIDPSANERLMFYHSAYLAFKDAPIFGHGFYGFVETTNQFKPIQYESTLMYDHLHSDIANFAVIGGISGIMSYFLLLFIPILIAIRSKKNRMAVIFGGVTLSSGYFLLGLTNTMFGILPQTLLFGVIIAVLVVISDYENAKPRE